MSNKHYDPFGDLVLAAEEAHDFLDCLMGKADTHEILDLLGNSGDDIVMELAKAIKKCGGRLGKYKLKTIKFSDNFFDDKGAQK